MNTTNTMNNPYTDRTDPTNDDIYRGMTVNDFLRHFTPRIEEQKEEMAYIRETGFVPFKDMDEEVYREAVSVKTASRAVRRRAARERKKKLKRKRRG